MFITEAELKEKVEEIIPEFMDYSLSMHDDFDIFKLAVRFSYLTFDMRGETEPEVAVMYQMERLKRAISELPSMLNQEELVVWNWLNGKTDFKVVPIYMKVYGKEYVFFEVDEGLGSTAPWRIPIKTVRVPLKKYIIRQGVIFVGVSIEYKKIIYGVDSLNIEYLNELGIVQ